MTYALDTNIIYDILFNDPVYSQPAIDFLSANAEGNALIACDVVWAETSAAFNDKAAFARQMAKLGITFSPMPEKAAVRAGGIWRLARATAHSSAAKQRLAIIPDFLIGAHAMECADALVTRDRGFMRKYFASLKIVDPSMQS